MALPGSETTVKPRPFFCCMVSDPSGFCGLTATSGMPRPVIATVRAIEAVTVRNPGYFIVMALLDALGARPEDLATHVGPGAAADEPLRHVTTLQGMTQARGITRRITSHRNPGIQRTFGSLTG